MSAGRRRAPSWRRYGWGIGAAVGVAAGFWVAPVVQDLQEEREARDRAALVASYEVPEEFPPPVDVVRELLRQDGRVAVADELADRVDPAAVALAEEALQAAPVPTWIAYLPASGHGEPGYTHSGAVAMWAGAVGEPGHYVGIFDDGRDEVYSVGYESPYLFDVGTKGQPGPVLERVAEAATTWEAEPLRVREVDDSDYWGGTAGGVGAGLLFVVVAVLPLFAGLRVVVGRFRTRRDA